MGTVAIKQTDLHKRNLNCSEIFTKQAQRRKGLGRDFVQYFQGFVCDRIS